LKILRRDGSPGVAAKKKNVFAGGSRAAVISV
jgi:hypothetical protein